MIGPASITVYTDRFDDKSRKFIEKRCIDLLMELEPEFGIDHDERVSLVEAAYALGFADAFDGKKLLK